MTSEPPPFSQPPPGQLRFGWPPGSASGAGSMPGTHPLQAVRIVLDELPALPYLPELPARGPGADMIGRTAALLTGLPVETTPGGWRLTHRPGRDLSRARAMLASDLDALEEAADGYQGPLKVQVCGPWTLAAALQLPASQDVALADHGAVSDLIQSLAESVAAHVADVGRRVPGAQLLLQLDEPSLPAVLAGAVPTASGLRRLAAVETGDATEGLRAQFESTGADGIVHCCAGHPPFEVLTKSGARAIYIDLSLLRREDEDPLAEAAEAGLGLFAGAISPGNGSPGNGSPGNGSPGDGSPGDGSPGRSAPGNNERGGAEAIATRVIDLWRHLGLPAARCTEQMVIAPACGLAGVSQQQAAAVLRACAEAARILPEMIEEGSA